MNGCSSLEELPSSIHGFSALTTLRLINCKQFKKLLGEISFCKHDICYFERWESFKIK